MRIALARRGRGLSRRRRHRRDAGGQRRDALNRAKETGQRYLFYSPRHERARRPARSRSRTGCASRSTTGGSPALPAKIDMRTSELAGLEALIRWGRSGARLRAAVAVRGADGGDRHDPRRRALGARRRRSRTSAAGRRSACTTAHRVNVSRLQLRQGDFRRLGAGGDRRIRRAPDPRPRDHRERAAGRHRRPSTRKLQILRRAGVEVSVDDFGTGYSSLNYPRATAGRYAQDRPQFVVRMQRRRLSAHIVAMIVSLAHTLASRSSPKGSRTPSNGACARSWLRPDPGLPDQQGAAGERDRLAAAKSRVASRP